MTAVLISFIISFVMWLLLNFMFISPFNRSLRIISMIASFTPFFGPIWQIAMWIAFFSEYRTESYHYDYDENGKQYIMTRNDFDAVRVRDNKVNRWLFDDINWHYIDDRKNISGPDEN